jgi:hypothetical protein
MSGDGHGRDRTTPNLGRLEDLARVKRTYGHKRRSPPVTRLRHQPCLIQADVANALWFGSIGFRPCEVGDFFVTVSTNFPR